MKLEKQIGFVPGKDLRVRPVVLERSIKGLAFKAVIQAAAPKRLPPTRSFELIVREASIRNCECGCSLPEFKRNNGL